MFSRPTFYDHYKSDKSEGFLVQTFTGYKIEAPATIKLKITIGTYANFTEGNFIKVWSKFYEL